MGSLITRRLSEKLTSHLKSSPVVAILGPRQCGKSTLAGTYLNKQNHTLFLDLERPADIRQLRDPEALFRLNDEKMICLDEIQRVPDLFPVIRYEVDRRNRNGQFLILGSASPELIRQSSESLAGRISFLELTPFLLSETGDAGFSDADRKLWLRGGFPRSYLAGSEEASLDWRLNFTRTFLERDIPALGLSIDTDTANRLWVMLAHSNGQVTNYSKLAGSLGITRNTVKKYINILRQPYMVRVLEPWHSNLKKRLVKSPKVYIRDTGILHSLLEIESQKTLLSHPAYGSSWESLAMENILASISPRWQPSFFRTEKGNEIDLVLEKGRERICIEFKASGAPDVGKGFWFALEDLNPAQSWIVAPVGAAYPYDSKKNVMVGSPMDVGNFLNSI